MIQGVENIGFNTHRLKSDDKYHQKEVIYAKVMNDYIKSDPEILRKITGTEHSNENILSEREEKLLLSLIQWLGTPVGEAFLRDVDAIYKKESNSKN